VRRGSVACGCRKTVCTRGSNRALLGGLSTSPLGDRGVRPVRKYFRWPQDQQVRITVRVSRDPRYGIAEFWIDHIVNATPKPSAR
jgi:hypothetical protein